jgi:cytochrome c556
MIQSNRARHVTAAVALAAAASVPLLSAQAEEVPMDKVEQAVKYRQNVMSAMGGLTGAAVGKLRDGFAFGPGLEDIATALQAMAADIPSLFPEGTDFGETDAMAEVWSDAEGFADKAAQAKDATAAFTEAVKSGDKIATVKAFRDVGDSCKGCHEAYRKQ